MNKYLLTIEFRYYKYSERYDDMDSTSKEVTIGIYNDFNDACINGNNLLVNLESKFPLHVFPKGRGTAKKERFSKNGGCFGNKKTLITNLAYLKTPFDFFAKITTLKYDDIDSTINDANRLSIDYINYRNKQ